MTCLCLKSNYSKTARNFLTIFRVLLEENISFHINLVSQLDALVCETGVCRNSKMRKHPKTKYGQPLSWHNSIRINIFKKTTRNFLARFRPGLEENISFHLNLVSQLDAPVGEADSPRNFDKRKQPYMAIYVYQLTWHAYVWNRIYQKRLDIS